MGFEGLKGDVTWHLMGQQISREKEVRKGTGRRLGTSSCRVRNSGAEPEGQGPTQLNHWGVRRKGHRTSRTQAPSRVFKEKEEEEPRLKVAGEVRDFGEGGQSLPGGHCPAEGSKLRTNTVTGGEHAGEGGAGGATEESKKEEQGERMKLRTAKECVLGGAGDQALVWHTVEVSFSCNKSEASSPDLPGS